MTLAVSGWTCTRRFVKRMCEEDKLLAEQLIKFLETVDVTLSYVFSLHTRVDLLATIAGGAHHHFLPIVFTSRLAAIAMFFMTPCIALVNEPSPSSHMVLTNRR